MPPLNPLTRRAFVAGLGLAATFARHGAPAYGQNDGVRVIHAGETGYDGAAPGPVLSLRRGEELKVRLVNDLPGPTAIHWHGVRVPNAMDGTALVQGPVAPGASFDYRFTPPDAGTFWYHPLPRTPQTRALHGLLIVREQNPPRVDEDILLMIDGAADGFTVNGKAVPEIPLRPKYRYRMRCVNAAERIVALRVEGHPMAIIAIDGQPAEPFTAREGITLAPGTRVDVLLDAIMKPESVAPILVRSEAGEVPLAQLKYGDGVVPPTATMPDGHAGETLKPLEPNPLPERMDFRNALRVDLDPNAPDGSLAAKPLFSVKRGRTVQLAIRNGSEQATVLHIHGHHVRLLDRLDDGWKPFWLDTILSAPRQTLRVAFVADNPGKWLISARPLGGSDKLAWFEVS